MDLDKKVEIIYSILNELEYGDLFDFNFSKLKKDISLNDYRMIEGDLLKSNLVRIKKEPHTNDTLNGVANYVIEPKGIEIRKSKLAIKEILNPKEEISRSNIITNNFNNSNIGQLNQSDFIEIEKSKIQTNREKQNSILIFLKKFWWQILIPLAIGIILILIEKGILNIGV
jgi:hypothetical protein